MKLGLSLLVALTGGFLAHPAFGADPMTARQVIARIQASTGGDWKGPTVDTFKAGDPNTPVTGIATTFTPTMSVLERAAAAGKNLIITHEPTFYNHLDKTTLVQSDPVYLEKQRFLAAHHMVVWRFHDHWHQAPLLKQDGILQGMMAELGWQKYQSQADPHRFDLPETNLKALAVELSRRLHSNIIRVVGSPEMKVTGVYFLPGSSGEAKQIPGLEKPGVQVLVAGEASEWETVEYARDASEQGRKKALILLGHDLSEEAGMSQCADWLRTILPGVPVAFIPAGEPFWMP